MKGYQYLQNNFFELCKTRKIRRIPMLLYIYLRGLYCRFQKPIFFWHDKTTKDHLGISQSTLSRARSTLREKGLIEFHSGLGSESTEYTMLGTILLPVVKKTTPSRHAQAMGSRQNDDTLYTSYERVKKKTGIERYDPSAKESVQLKNSLYLLLHRDL